MAFEKMEGTLAAANKTLTITPSKLVDNSRYKIIVTGLKNKETGEDLPAQTIELKSAYSPMYCTLESLKMLVDTFDVPDENMRSYIRDASKYADLVADGEAVQEGEPVPYAVEQFTRTKATLDCLLRTYMNAINHGGAHRYKLDVVEYEEKPFNPNALKPLLDALKGNLKKWEDAVRGYFPEGRCKPVVTRPGIKSASNSAVNFETVDFILNDFTRTSPQWG